MKQKLKLLTIVDLFPNEVTLFLTLIQMTIDLRLLQKCREKLRKINNSQLECTN